LDVELTEIIDSLWPELRGLNDRQGKSWGAASIAWVTQSKVWLTVVKIYRQFKIPQPRQAEQ